MNSFKVALCFSGQARCWRTAVSNIKRFFSGSVHPETGQPVVYDTFIHTWDINTFRKNAMSQEYDIEPVTQQDQDELRKSYLPIKMEVESFDRFKNSTNQLFAWDPMFYSFMKSVHYKRSHELENDFEYDLVVKVRFDVIYDPKHPFVLHKVDSMVGYTGTPISKFFTELNYNNFDDVTYYGDSKTMDLLSHTYRLHKQKRAQQPSLRASHNEYPEFLYGPGCLLYKTMVDMTIHPCSYYRFAWYVVRKNVENSGLDSVEDWDKISALCAEWYK